MLEKVFRSIDGTKKGATEGAVKIYSTTGAKGSISGKRFLIKPVVEGFPQLVECFGTPGQALVDLPY